MAEVIWAYNATEWRIDALAYGSSTFGQKSAEKLDNIFKTYSYRLEPEDRETADRVLIIDVWDTRMNPDFLAARIPAAE